jgi:hypothetical protein
MLLKSALLSAAPPINPPSTFGQANNSLAFVELQLPPYKIEIPAAISVVYFNSKTETSEIVEKLQEDGLETELDSATKRIKLMSSKLSKILNNLSGVSFALIDILAYTALTHVIPYLGKIVFDIGSEATSEVALKALGMSVGLKMFGSSIKKVLKMLSKKLESHENV